MTNEQNLGLILENQAKSEDYIFQKSLKIQIFETFHLQGDNESLQ